MNEYERRYAGATKCYFSKINDRYLCVGTIHDFFGEYYASTHFVLPEGYDPTDKTYLELRTLFKEIP